MAAVYRDRHTHSNPLILDRLKRQRYYQRNEDEK
jgi:hypothetical protein